MRVEESVEIRAPIERVFAAITDPLRATEWNGNIVSVHDVSGLPVHVGTTWRQTACMAGRELNLTCTVKRFDPPWHGELEITGDHSGRLVTACRWTGLCTRVQQTLEFVPPGGLAGRMASTVLRPMVRREMKQTLTRQREVLEREFGTRTGEKAT